MKGKISTKTIVIAILTVVLLAIATAGTVLFLKDSGEVAAKNEKQNSEVVLPVDNENSEVAIPTENDKEESSQTEQQTEVVNEGRTVRNNGTIAQTTRNFTEQPEISTLERERIASEITTLGWKNISRNGDNVDFGNKNLNYKLNVTAKKENTLGENNAVRPGDTFDYRIILTNTGNKEEIVPVKDTIPEQLEVIGTSSNDIDINNLKNNVVNFGDIKIKAGETIILAISVKVKEGTVESFKNVAIVDGREIPEEKPVEVINIIAEKENTITQRDEEQHKIIKPGEEFTYKIILTNIGTIEGTTTVIDAIPEELEIVQNPENATVAGNIVTFNNVLVKPGESNKVGLTIKVKVKPQVIGEIKNIATLVESNDIVIDKDIPTVVPVEKISLVKEVVGEANKKYDLGETINYKVTVTNEGNVTLENIEVKDDNSEEKTKTIEKIEVGKTEKVEFTHIVTEEDIKEQQGVTNIAYVQNNDGSKTESEPVVTPVANINKELSVEKEVVEKKAEYELGEKVDYKVTIENKGNQTVQGIVVEDVINGTTRITTGARVDKQGNIVQENVDLTTGITLKPGEKAYFTYSYEVLKEDIILGKIVNAVTASAGEDVKPGTDNEEVKTEEINKELSVEKEVVEKKAEYKLGEKVDYKVTIENKGNQTVQGIVVEDVINGTTRITTGARVDEQGNIVQENADLTTGITLEPGEKAYFTYSYEVTVNDVLKGKIVNAVTASAGEDVKPGTDNKEVTTDTIDYSITYNLDEGTLAENISNPKKYNERTETFTLNNPIRVGYTFAGWTGTGYQEITKTVTIPKGSTGNRSYDAHWTKNQYNYKVEYYYENDLELENKVVLDGKTFVKWDAKTEPGDTIEGSLKADYNETVTTYPTEGKEITGYELYKVTPADDSNNAKLVIAAENEDNIVNNIIKVYYTKKQVPYTVNYYLENTTTKLTTSKNGTGTYGSTITEQAVDLTNIGYTAIKEQDEITLNKVEGNVLDLYYKARKIGYSVEYYYNGIKDESKTYESVEEYGKTVTTYPDKSNNGEWTLESATSITIGLDKTENIIIVKYAKPIITATKKATIVETNQANPTGAIFGNTIRYDITLINSASVAGVVNITDTIPVNTTYVNNSITNNGTLNGTRITWSNINVPANSSNTVVSFKVTINENSTIGSKINNTATVKDENNTNIIAQPSSGEITILKSVKVTAENVISVDKTNVVLVLDRSSSMNDSINGTKKINLAKNTMVDFVNKLYSSNADEPAKLSIVVFAGGAFDSEKDLEVLNFANGSTVSSNKTDIINAINSISVPSRIGGTATCIGRALEETYEVINGLKNSYPSNKNIVIFLGDGEPTGPGNGTNISKYANKIKNEVGAKLYTVAFNMGESDTLKNMSSGTGYYFTADNGSELINSYNTILEIEGDSTENNIATNLQGKIEINLNGNTVKYPINVTVGGTTTSYNYESLPANIQVTSTQIIWDVSSYQSGTYLELKYNVN